MWPALRWTNTFLFHMGHQTLGTFACPTIQMSRRPTGVSAATSTVAASKATCRAWIYFSTWLLPTVVLMWREEAGL